MKDDPGYRFLHGDICDPAAVAEAMAGCDVVLNFAAETHVDRSIDSAKDFVLTDTFGVWVLLEEARRSKVLRFLQISTDEVYGEILDRRGQRGGAASRREIRTRRPRSAAIGSPTPTTPPTACRPWSRAAATTTGPTSIPRS